MRKYYKEISFSSTYTYINIIDGDNYIGYLTCDLSKGSYRVIAEHYHKVPIKITGFIGWTLVGDLNIIKNIETALMLWELSK
jgi:hypothetical protein